MILYIFFNLLVVVWVQFYFAAKAAGDNDVIQDTNAMKPNTKIMMMGSKEADIVCNSPCISTCEYLVICSPKNIAY